MRKWIFYWKIEILLSTVRPERTGPGNLKTMKFTVIDKSLLQRDEISRNDNALKWQIISFPTQLTTPSIHSPHSSRTFCSSLRIFSFAFCAPKRENIHLSHFSRRKYDKVRLKIIDLTWVRFRYIDTYTFAAKRSAHFSHLLVMHSRAFWKYRIQGLLVILHSPRDH